MMQSDNLVSVVVPIYNTDLGILAQCLDSPWRHKRIQTWKYYLLMMAQTGNLAFRSCAAMLKRKIKGFAIFTKKMAASAVREI